MGVQKAGQTEIQKKGDIMETAVLLLAISSVLLSLRAVIDDFRRIKEQKNWFRKESEPEENYLTSSKSHEEVK